MSLQEAQQFVVRFVREEYTPEEYAAFSQWLKEATTEELTIIADTYEASHGKWVLPGGPSAGWIAGLEQKLDVSVEESEETKELVVATVMGDREWVRPRRIIRWNAWMSAAAVVVVVSAGTYTYVHQLGSGSEKKQDLESSLSMTVVNPRGGAQKEIVLEDGSKVWLNAASVLKYPSHFTDTERMVELSGEAFFDVAKRSGDPFRVRIKDAEVEVLGTYFNVVAYDDEPGSRTILVNGAVKVMRGQQSMMLKPGDEAEIPYTSPGVSPEIVVHSNIDLKAVMAWKGGVYRFIGVDLRTVMREIARVYDLKVQYQSNVDNPRINGILNLNDDLEKVLTILEGSFLYEKSKIHFTINGKTVLASSV